MKGDTRCVEGRIYRHDPQHDDPDLETDIGECPDCDGKGCDEVSILKQRIDRLRDALDQIVAAHLGDCPTSMDETDFARAHNYRVRTIARNALIADEGASLDRL